MNIKKNPVYDFSSWEDNIKWDAMVGDNKPLAVIMRASIQNIGTRTRYEDAKAIEYVSECKKRNIKYGLYHLLSPNGIAEQAALFLGVWNKCGGAGLAPIVDVEVDLQASYKGTIGNAVWQSHVKTFLDLISAGTGKTPIIYTNRNYWSFVMTKNLIGQMIPPTWTADYPLWVAQYPTNPDAATTPAFMPAGWAEWIMWQYADNGRQNGFLANDLNTCSEEFAAELLTTIEPPNVSEDNDEYVSAVFTTRDGRKVEWLPKI
jgi:GH25 family lysozyme M1 (1,4-beta-N-acetylmuramidase)